MAARDNTAARENVATRQKTDAAKLAAAEKVAEVDEPGITKPLIDRPLLVQKPSVVSRTGLMVLLLLVVQNSFKNIITRWAMKDQPKILTSAAVIGAEFIKLTLSTLYILFVQNRSLASIVKYVRDDFRNTLLITVPASAYNLNMSLEYVALSHLSSAMFAVVCQTKLLFTAVFASIFLRKRLKYIQVISLVLLTSGVMLCNIAKASDKDTKTNSEGTTKGILATLTIALTSGFASVFTEKVIKGAGTRKVQTQDYGLAYTQVQLAGTSLVSIGLYAFCMDLSAIQENGLFQNFSPAAFLSVVLSATSGLVVAMVLKYTDSILKGYATALAVIASGMLSMLIFNTQLTVLYYMGVVNVVIAVILYNGRNLDQFICW